MDKCKKIKEKTNKLNLDNLNLDIIRELRVNARQSWRELAKKLNVSPMTIMNRIKALERNGVITGYTIKCDQQKLGFELLGFTEINVAGKYFDETVQELLRRPDIRDVYAISGEFDLLVFYRAKTMHELANTVQSLYKMNEVKTHSFIAVAMKENYGIIDVKEDWMPK